MLLLAALVGCYPLPADPIPTETPTLTATLTSTPVWFPATATPTMLPTPERSATPIWRPGVGDLILEDGFDAEEEWFPFTGTIGNLAFNDGHLTLAINQPSGMIYAFRETPVLSDFYVEVTASVKLCQNTDEFGLMVRVSGVRRDHYRLALTCSGEAKAVRVYGNNSVVIYPLEQYPEVAEGFPSESRLGVWVVDDEIRFFVNDRYLFSVVDPVIGEGAIGVYVRTTGNDPISVVFSQLEIYEILN